MTVPRLCLVAAPLGLFTYGILRWIGRLAQPYGPGPAWQVAHTAALIGIVLFVPAVIGLRRLLPAGPQREITVLGTLLGLAATAVQFAVDIGAATGAADHAAMVARTAAFASVPGVRLAVYQVGPALGYAGLVALAVLLVLAGRLRWWSVALVLAGVVLPVVNLDLIAVGAVCLLTGFGPLIEPELTDHSGLVEGDAGHAACVAGPGRGQMEP
ncbi:MAG TPA: hypothetical protein VFW65_16895 [Pseudonocardiaceae bacterium]|nr:hypothetical protein [Pseudonocardiaceae bacterium]